MNAYGRLTCGVIFAVLLGDCQFGVSAVETMTFRGYADCILLQNEHTRVVLCPASGGRVLEYSLNGNNALYLDQNDVAPETLPKNSRHVVSAGRFDIGPEHIIPQRTTLWSGKWTGKATGPFSARLTSPKDESTGVQLIRDFTLAPDSAQLECRQTIRNVSKETKHWCHWSRTFALGGGICVIPLTEPSRFPHKYVMYGPGNVINFRPTDANIRVRDGVLEITGTPQQPKLGFDSYAGWFAYLMKNDMLFIKRYPTDRNRVYNEMAGLTISIWYYKNEKCELEPIGPRETLAPGEQASFTEEWTLIPFQFPQPGKDVNLQDIRQAVANLPEMD